MTPIHFMMQWMRLVIGRQSGFQPVAESHEFFRGEGLGGAELCSDLVGDDSRGRSRRAGREWASGGLGATSYPGGVHQLLCLGDGDGGAGEDEAVAARGFALEDGGEIGEASGEDMKEIVEGQGVEAVDPGEHLLVKGGVFPAREAAGMLVAVAEPVAPFGEAAAVAAVGVKVGAFLDWRHGFPSGNRKGRRDGSLFLFLLSIYRIPSPELNTANFL